MRRFLISRLLQLIPVLLVGSIGVWGLAYLLPGNPAVAFLGPDASATQLAAEEKMLGLDRPLPLQYVLWLGRAVQGNFGISDISRLPVTTLMGPAAVASLQLAVFAFVIALLIGIPLGVWAAQAGDRFAATLVSWYSSLTLGVPTFWLGILLILLFGVATHVLPTSSQYIPVWDDPADCLRALLLPALTLGLYMSGIIARFVRGAMDTELHSEYVQLADAKGISRSRIVWKHALRNAMLPTVTIVGLQFGTFIGGAVVTEAVFNYPGMGTLILNALLQRDYPTLQGAILVVIAAFVVVNLLVDVVYAVLDPRIKFAS